MLRYQRPLLNLGIDDAPLRTSRQIRAPQEFLDEVTTQFVAARIQQGLSAAEVDYMVGCADRLVQKWEVGARMPSGFMMWCWARSLNRKIVLV